MSELPNGWLTASLSDICTRIVDGSHNPPKAVDVGFPMLSARNIQNRRINFNEFRFISETDFALENARTDIKTGDVLLTIVGTIGRTAVVPSGTEPFTLQRSVAVLKPLIINSYYLAYSLESPSVQQYLFENAVGSAQKGIYLRALAQVEIPLAPLKEQKRIADKLDSLLARVDTCRDRLDRVPRILKRFRQSILTEAFSGKFIENWQVDHSEQSSSNNSSISGQLADFADVIDPNPSHRYPSYVGGTIPLLATEQMHSLNDWDISSAKLTTLDFYETRISAHDFLNDDVIFARKGRLGLARNPPTNIRYAFSHTVFIIRAKTEKVLPSFLLWFLRQEWCIDWLLLEMNSNAGVPTLGKLVMEHLPITVPDYTEQQRIVQYIENLYASVDRLEVRYQNALRQVEQITSTLLSKAFCGELVPQDPNDEPATILLERIRAGQIAKPKRVVVNRKPKMPKMTEESVKEVIRQLPSETFSFDELRKKISGDYDSFKDILFTLLDETEPSLMQVFEQEAMRFVRRNQ